MRMHRVELFRLVLGDFQHLHAEDTEAIFFELLDDVADTIFVNRVGLDDRQCTFQRLHDLVVSPQSLVVSNSEYCIVANELAASPSIRVWLGTRNSVLTTLLPQSHPARKRASRRWPRAISLL